jgi:hypothetical protein
MSGSTHQDIRDTIASASRAELEALRRRAVAVLERVQAVSKYRLRSKVEEIEADIAIETLAEVDAALGRRGKWFLARRRLQLRMKYLR